MNKAVQDTESSNDEETYKDCKSTNLIQTLLDLTNPQKRKQFDILRLYHQQKELQKMSGYHHSLDVDIPQRLKQQEMQKNYATVSLFCLSVTNPFRDKMIRIVVNPWFDRFILMTILANCIFLAIDDPNAPPFDYQVISDKVFQIIFTVEMTFKIIAMGFAMRPFSYLRDPWNVLDFIVVVMGWVSQVVTASNVSAIRVIRILRPLRTINSIPSMRKLVQSLLNSLPTMFDVFVMFMFFMVMFGTIATQLFGGLLSNRCQNIFNELQDDGNGNEAFCQLDSDCQKGYFCVYKGNPDYGVSNFDDILSSILNMFIIITLEGWSTLMYYVRHATRTIAYDIFFVLVVIFGAFFLINLMVAVQFSYLSASFQEMASKNKNPSKEVAIEEAQTPINQEANQSEADNFEQAVNQIQSNSHSPEQVRDISNNDRQSDGLQNPTLMNNLPNSELQAVQQNAENQKKKVKIIKCCPCWIKLKTKCFILSENRIFNIVIICLILVNTLFMSMNYYEMPSDLDNALQIGNEIMTCIFAVEMCIKFIGLGPKLYVMDGFNDFDAIIVVIGLLEFANVGSKAITVLRTFRLLRIFKILRSWVSLRKLLQTILSSFQSISNLALLMGLLIFIYALIGMQFFSGIVLDEDGNEFRYNFNTFINSMITIFILLTAENWNAVLYVYINQSGWAASIFFVSMIIFGNIMLLNLFLAILLNFISENLDDELPPIEKDGDQEDKEEVIEEDLNYIQEKLRQRQTKSILGFSGAGGGSVSNKQPIIEGAEQDEVHEGNCGVGDETPRIRVEDINVNINAPKPITEKSHEDGTISDGQQNQKEIAIPFHQNPDYNADQIEEFRINQQPLNTSQLGNSKIIQMTQGSTSKSFKKKNKNATILIVTGKSLYLLGENNKFRLLLKEIMEHPYFENLIFHFIALNSILLALDAPILTEVFQNNTMELYINVISGIFIAEAFMKILVLGFVIGPGTYLKDSWNILDFVIVSFSVLNWILDSLGSVSVSFLRGFRALRALRPLRVVSKNEGMKVVVNSLLTAIPALFNVILITLLFLLVFGILAVQLFSGAMGKCTDSEIMDKSLCKGEFINEIGVVSPREWKIPFNNYDNVVFSMITFFEVATLEAWPDTLFATIDSQGLDQGPILNNRPYIAILFVVFIFITTFFIMNLFVSVIVDKFNDEIKKKEGSDQFSDEQKEWVKMQRIMLHINLKIRAVSPKNKFRKFFFKLVQHSKFEFFISTMIGFNTLFLCIDYTQKTLTYSKVLDFSNFVFLGIFAFECIFKMIAYGFKFYFLDNWNRFDLLIVILSIIASDESIFPFKITALRIIRVARLLRMVKASKGLRNLLKALWLSLGNIMNVGMILFLIFFTFSVAGMDLFGNIDMGGQVTNDANFTTFYQTLITLFRCATGENWNGMMHDCFEQTGVIGILYWMAFELITHYVFLNVFIAVIYDSFNDVKASENESDVLSLKRKDIKAFVRTWAIFCPTGNPWMKTITFPAFLQELPPPLGYGGIAMEPSKLNKIIFCLNIKSHIKEKEGKVYFPEVMWAIFHSIIGNNDEKVYKCEQVTNIMKALKIKYKGLGKNLTPEGLCGNKYYKTEMTVSKYLCALQIYKHWVTFKEKRNRALSQKLNPSPIKMELSNNQLDNYQNIEVTGQLKFSDQSDANFIQNPLEAMKDNKDVNQTVIRKSSKDIMDEADHKKSGPKIPQWELQEEQKDQDRKNNNQNQSLILMNDNQMEYQESSSESISNCSEDIGSPSQRDRQDKLDYNSQEFKIDFIAMKGNNNQAINQNDEDQYLETEKEEELLHNQYQGGLLSMDTNNRIVDNQNLRNNNRHYQ